ncbi:type VII secretion integral membrane protein EccD [Mycolicibacterium moriokaense]|uniref:Type VII secretion integral membrane protein EccD n=1 Tax=Mycolicibacterium moriokaense TaxID=39691 RepID=A0AAD1HFB7_9MYCO|nr:type VII secretion integral membrane protein EccD [Mycolicibacterium moriokaense]
MYDNDVHHGEVLLLTATEPPIAKRVACDPCLAVASGVPRGDAPVLRVLPAVCCVVLGGLGALVLAWSGTRSHVLVGLCLAVAGAGGAIVHWRVRGDPLICVPLSLVGILYAGAVGFLSVPSETAAPRLLLASAAVFFVAILLLQSTSSTTYLTAIATVSALTTAVTGIAATWRLEFTACGAGLVIFSLAILGMAPKLSMILSRTPVDSAAHVTQECHLTLTGLVVGSAVAAALGAASVAVGEGSALCGTTFTGVVALVLLLRMRTHVDPTRRAWLAAAAMLTAATGFAATAFSVPDHVPVISALATISGAATLTYLAGPTVSPIVVRTVEVIEYIALAAVVPLACWVAGVFGLAGGI